MNTPTTSKAARATTYKKAFDRDAFFRRMFQRFETHGKEKAITNALITLEVAYGAVGLLSPLARGVTKGGF